ncbi:MAG: hypothetical protein Q8O14_14770 [bacterium]|nr:hypothetical protein [bacterium]
MSPGLPTDRGARLVMDCTLIICWKAEIPDRHLPDLPRSYAERLLEDLVDALRPHLTQLEIREQLATGEPGRRLRLWDTCCEHGLVDVQRRQADQAHNPANIPPHSDTWFIATGRAISRAMTRPVEGE